MLASIWVTGTIRPRWPAVARRVVVAALCVACTLLLVLAPAARAGQIVYRHGTDLWAMNDNGSDPHLVLSASQVGGAIETGAGGSHAIGVQPGGTGIAFDAEVPPAGGVCNDSDHCPGIYSLLNGKLTRLTPAPARCSFGVTYCGGEETDPAVTRDGRVIYDSLFVTSTPDCGLYYCGIDGTVVEEYYAAALNASRSPRAWPLPPAPGNNDQLGADPAFEGSLAADPANANKIAYGGNYLQGLNCGPNGSSNCYPLVVESSARTYNQPALDDSFYYGLAFSANGSKIADIETGDEKGIWVYPSNQTWGTLSSPNSSAKFTWALVDPDNSSGGQFDQVIKGLTFVGNGELVFSADNNLWAIPSRCWSKTTSSSSPAANCHYPRDAIRLTHDGTPAKPNLDPVWTSATATISSYAKSALKLKLSSRQKLLVQHSVKGTLRCNQRCRAHLTGSIRIKGLHKTLKAKSADKTVSGGHTLKFALKLSSKARRKIAHALRHHKPVKATVVATARYAVGGAVSTSRSFRARG